MPSMLHHGETIMNWRCIGRCLTLARTGVRGKRQAAVLIRVANQKKGDGFQ